MIPPSNSYKFSEYGALSQSPSPVARMMSAFTHDFRESVDINLGVGYVNEKTIPRRLIRLALDHVLSHPETYSTPLNYGGPTGSPLLIKAVRNYLLEHQGFTEPMLSDRMIIIGPNGATSLLEGLADVLEPGIVITTDPMYYIYCDFLERKGFRVVTVPEKQHGLEADDVSQRIVELGDKKHKISFIYVVTVSNPTSSILSNENRRNLVELAARVSEETGRRIPLILDKAYEDLIHDPSVEPLQSGFHHDESGLVYEIGTLSKVLAPSLRIGYVIGRKGPLLAAMVQRTSDNGFSAPLITQEIAGWLLENHVKDQIARVRSGYREKAIQLQRWIDEYLGKWLANCRGGRAGFYFYLTFEDVNTDERSPFFRYLSRTTGDTDVDGPDENKKPRVIYVPGEFCVHPRGQIVELGRRQLRISYGFEDIERIGQAIDLMGQAAEWAVTRQS